MLKRKTTVAHAEPAVTAAAAPAGPAIRGTRATLSDVAERAGVAKSTVSMILNRHPNAGGYSQATRQRVQEAARELGYRPNLFATQLRRGDHRWLMLCMASFREVFAARVAHAFEVRAAARGYRLVVSALNVSGGGDQFARRDVLGQHGVSALAVVGQATEQLLPSEVVAQLAEEGTDCLLINRDLDHPRVSRVLVDHAVGQRALARQVYEEGAQRVVMLAGPPDWPLGRQRRQALDETAAELGRPRPAVVHTPTTESRDGHRATLDLLSDAGVRPPDAIVAANDYLAYGALLACSERGLRVGHDIAVVGFDDIFPSEFSVPPLTTVRLPMDDMGRIGADLLIDGIEGKPRPGMRVTLPTSVVLRRSHRLMGRASR